MYIEANSSQLIPHKYKKETLRLTLLVHDAHITLAHSSAILYCYFVVVLVTKGWTRNNFLREEGSIYSWFRKSSSPHENKVRSHSWQQIFAYILADLEAERGGIVIFF